MKKVVGLLSSLVVLATGNAANAVETRGTKPAIFTDQIVYNWTGFYVGANAGAAWGRSDTNSPLSACAGAPCFVDVVADINAQQAQSLNATGFTGGLQAGYNRQFGHLVVGAEADLDSFRLSNSASTSAYFTGFPGPGTPPTYTNAFWTNWLFTGRGRLGYAANRWLAYATGGVAVTDLHYAHNFVVGTFPAPGSDIENSNASATKVGYAVGGGIEYGLSRNWTIKAEYLYLNFGSVNSSGAINMPDLGILFNGIKIGTTLTNVFHHSANLSADVARIGMNYHF